jgi:hypothetical protein
VNLCEGTWYAKVVIATSGSDPEIVGLSGPDVTTLTSGGGSGSVVSVSNASATIRGLTITGGEGSVSSSGSTQGGGVVANQNTGAMASSPNLVLDDCIVTSNTAQYGGGVAVLKYGWIELDDTLVDGNDGTAAGGGLWMQDYGKVTCAATTLGAAGFVANTSPIGGGMYLSNSTSGTVESVGCDWGDDASGDDNATYDIQQNPRATDFYCYPNAASLSDTVSCSGGSCTSSTDATCP